MARENLPLHFWSLWLHSAHPHWQHLDAGGPLKTNWKITHVWIQGPQLVLISPPRPWFGRPVRPTIEPPRALLSGTLDLEVRMVIASNFHYVELVFQAHALLMKQRVKTMRSVCK